MNLCAAGTTFVVLLVIVSLALLLTGILQARQAVLADDVVAAKFANGVAYVGQHVNESLEETLQQLNVVAEHLAATADVAPFAANATAFVRFAYSAAPPRLPIAVGWAPFVPRAQAMQFQTAVRSVNAAIPAYANFTLNSTRTGPNDTFLFPLLFSYPASAATRFGYDLLSDAPTAQAISLAIRTRAAASTVAMQTASVVFYKPAFSYTRNNTLLGVAFSAFRLEWFIRSALALTDNSTLQIRWIDTDNETRTEIVLYQLHQTLPPDRVADSVYAKNVSVAFAQRNWLIEVRFTGILPSLFPVTTIVLFAIVFGAVCVFAALLGRYRWRVEREKRRRQLLTMVVPEHVIAKLIPHLLVVDGDATLDDKALVADVYRNVTLCFIDICDFTAISSTLPPAGLVRFLDELVSLIDSIVAQHPRVLKIKTIGDAYMVAAGVHEPYKQLMRRPSVLAGSARSPREDISSLNDGFGADALQHVGEVDCNLFSAPNHVRNLVSTLRFCLDVQRTLHSHVFRISDEPAADEDKQPRALSNDGGAAESVESLRVSRVLASVFDKEHHELRVSVRIGVHVGGVVAGVVGTRRPQYDVWGDTCNVAARIESSAVNGSIQVSHVVHQMLLENHLGHLFEMRKRDTSLVLKGLGAVDAYTLSEPTREWFDAR